LREYLSTKELNPKRLLELYYAHPAAEKLRAYKEDEKAFTEEIKKLIDD
jgi:hypothetical protein